MTQPTLPTVVGLQEIASHLGVKPRTPHAWKFRGLLPEPDHAPVNGLDAWQFTTIVRWAAETGRLPSGLRAFASQIGVVADAKAA